MGITVHIVDKSIPSDALSFRYRSSRKAGDVIITLGYLCNGVVAAVQLARKGTVQESIDLMVFYGHGTGGLQAVSMGQGTEGSCPMAAITLDSLDDPVFAAQLRSIGPHFTKQGIIVLHGCNVAEGDQGRNLLKKLPRIVGVPVQGSTWYQIVGRSDLAGDVVTAYPNGAVKEQTLLGLINLGNLPVAEALTLLSLEIDGIDRLLKHWNIRKEH